jgi:hypothetical protein
MARLYASCSYCRTAFVGRPAVASMKLILLIASQEKVRRQQSDTGQQT